jgi:hypothetical protein
MRRRGPVPYELMRTDRGGAAAPIGDREPPPIGPGRSLRVPMGYVPVVAMVVLLVGAAGYVWGFSRGRSEARQDAARTLESAMATRTIADPLGGAGAASPGPDGRGAAAPPPRERSGTAAAPPLAAALPLPPAGDGDPRVPGLNYFVLSHTAPAMGESLVAFCRSEGLEAHLVEDHRGVRRKVIVVPGYADGDRLSPQVQALERRIREVGLRWRAQRRGNEDFSGYYPELFRGG